MARILVVDDDPDIRELVRFKLEASGHAALTAADGETALAVASAEHPDVVLADWMMPRMTGVELLDHLRSDPRTAAIPFILLTARLHDAGRLGADGVVAKPFSLRELTESIDAVLACRA